MAGVREALSQRLVGEGRIMWELAAGIGNVVTRGMGLGRRRYDSGPDALALRPRVGISESRLTPGDRGSPGDPGDIEPAIPIDMDAARERRAMRELGISEAAITKSQERRFDKSGAGPADTSRIPSLSFPE